MTNREAWEKGFIADDHPKVQDYLSKGLLRPRPPLTPSHTPIEPKRKVFGTDARKISYGDPNAESMKRQISELPQQVAPVLRSVDRKALSSVMQGTAPEPSEEEQRAMVDNALGVIPTIGELSEVKVFGKPRTISTNPSKSELYKYLREQQMQNRHNGYSPEDHQLRWIVDEGTGDIHFANAFETDHQALAEAVGAERSHQGFVTDPRSLDTLFQDPYLFDLTKGRWGKKPSTPTAAPQKSFDFSLDDIDTMFK